MCAEVKDERGFWQCLPGRANHHFDLAVYRYAAADILMLGDEKPDEPESQPERPVRQEQRPQKRRRW
jgi:phage terminase large subunit GpA-like protein